MTEYHIGARTVQVDERTFSGDWICANCGSPQQGAYDLETGAVLKCQECGNETTAVLMQTDEYLAWVNGNLNRRALKDVWRIVRAMERGDWVDDWPGQVKELSAIMANYGLDHVADASKTIEDFAAEQGVKPFDAGSVGALPDLPLLVESAESRYKAALETVRNMAKMSIALGWRGVYCQILEVVEDALSSVAEKAKADEPKMGTNVSTPSTCPENVSAKEPLMDTNPDASRTIEG